MEFIYQKDYILSILFVIYSSLFIYCGDSKAIYALGEEDPGRDGYYDEETPKDWVDILFILLISIHHFEYAFKFTDYSLSHIHLKTHKISAEDEEEENELGNMDQNELETLTQRARSQSVGDKLVEKLDVLELFTTESDSKTKRRPMHNRICCCIRFSPRFFTWNRTYLIRTFLKFYLVISCLLAMVLYAEFFMNLFVEYLITCIVHYQDAYVLALIMIPVLLFVCDVLIRLAWQAVVVSWSLNCDANGDLEAMDSQVGIAALRNQIMSSKRLLYTFTNDAREAFVDDDYHESSAIRLIGQEKEENHNIFTHLKSLINNSDNGKNPKNSSMQRSASYKDFDLDEYENDDRGDIELITQNGDTADLQRGRSSSKRSKLAEMLADENQEIDPTVVVQQRQRRKTHEEMEAMKKADKAAHRAKMGDFFMATCWRFGFFFYSVIFGSIAAWSLEVEVAINGLYWQLVMRYCVLGGIMWTMIYSTCALFVAVAARYRSWNLIHENIPRYRLFLLTDAHDLEGEKGWSRCKTAIMLGSILTCIILIALSWIFINQTWSSFVHFIGIIWALYYLINLFMACKPYALIALWTDTIPPPGKNATAHNIAKDALKAKGLYKSKRDLGLNPVAGMLEIATSAALDNEPDSDQRDPNDTQIEMAIQSEDETSNDLDDDDNRPLNKSPISVQSSVPSNPSMNAPKPMINDEENNQNGTEDQVTEEEKENENETIVTDNLRSVKSTKRILKENTDDQQQEDEQDEENNDVNQDDVNEDNVNEDHKNEDDVNEDAVNEDDMNEDDKNEDDKNEDNVKEDDVNEDDTNEDDAIEDNANEDDKNQDDVNDDDINEDDTNEDNVNEDDVNEDDVLENLYQEESSKEEKEKQKEKEKEEDNIKIERNKSEPEFVKLSSGISEVSGKSDMNRNGTTRINSVSKGESEMMEKERRAKQKKAMKKQMSLKSQTFENLKKRYQNYQYEYEECYPEQYDGCNAIPFCKFEYQKNKILSFLHNYEQYWLNVYRPFDEYDIESQMSSSHILYGFQWIKPICACKIMKKRQRKTHGQRCYTICKYLMDNFCNLCIVATVIIFMVGLLQTSQRLSGNNEAFREKVIYETNQTGYYGICSDGFGELGGKEDLSKFDLTVLDMIVLSQLAYEADNYDLCQVIDVWFDHQFKLVKIHREEPFYFHIRHKEAALDFVAIRGTDNLIEMMQDLSLFVEVGIFETLQWIVPFLNGLPISFIRQIIYYASYIEGVINADSRSAFDEPVESYLQNYLRRLESNCTMIDGNNDGITDWNGETTVYLVGHSLGGGISEIVAANLHEWATENKLTSHVQSFGVCSPGVLLSSAKFGFGVEALDKTSTSLLPRRDIVSKVDEHGGSIQYSECDASSFLQCHMTDNVLCEVFYGCPSDLATGPKYQWLKDFCFTSAANNETIGKAQIGKSILHYVDTLKMNNNGNWTKYNITDINDWEFEEILATCDTEVYDFCNKTQTSFQNRCWQGDFGNSDICFSESNLRSDNS